jgi:hypothetical protein
MKYRLSMCWWKLRCAWCDVKIAFGYLFNSKGAPELNIPRPTNV